MKLPVFVMVAAFAGSSLLAADSSPNLSEEKERISYALGVNFGSNLKKEGLEVNLDAVRKGIEDALAGNPKLTDAELRQTWSDLQALMAAKRQEKANANKEASQKWLAENATKPGVQQTPSGLQYKIIQEGTGPSPAPNDRVSVKYTGKLIDGTVFDTTDNNAGNPRQFAVNGVIRGWSEALQMMKKGAKWEIYIPSELGYGPNGNRGIPGNAALIFEVELVDIHPAAERPPQQPVTSDIIKVPSAEELKAGAKIEILKPEDVEKEIQKEKARKEAEEKKSNGQE